MKLSREERQLVRRYLIWCYKTTKEELDRVDRYFTQLKVDKRVLARISEEPHREAFDKQIQDFAAYMDAKEKRVRPKTAEPEYAYLKSRLKALEETICEIFSEGELTTIQGLYEEEMTRRILEAREHT